MENNWSEGWKAFYSDVNFRTHRMVSRATRTTVVAWEVVSISAIRQISIELMSPVQEEIW